MALTYKGTAGFTASGPARWQINYLDLDRLIVPMLGHTEDLAAYLSSIAAWSASGIDGNMFLSDKDTNQGRQFTGVDLIYLGKRSGTLPAAAIREGRGVLEAQFTSNGFTDDDGLRISVTYKAPTTSKTIWGRSVIAIDDVGATTPDDCEVIAFHADATGSYVSLLPGDNAAAQAFFAQFIVSTGDCEEIVPGEYFRATETKQNTLISTES